MVVAPKTPAQNHHLEKIGFLQSGLPSIFRSMGQKSSENFSLPSFLSNMIDDVFESFDFEIEIASLSRITLHCGFVKGFAKHKIPFSTVFVVQLFKIVAFEQFSVIYVGTFVSRIT